MNYQTVDKERLKEWQAIRKELWGRMPAST
jgi:hypothetical protein